jgi:hypothetical protein
MPIGSFGGLDLTSPRTVTTTQVSEPTPTGFKLDTKSSFSISDFSGGDLLTGLGVEKPDRETSFQEFMEKNIESNQVGSYISTKIEVPKDVFEEPETPEEPEIQETPEDPNTKTGDGTTDDGSDGGYVQKPAGIQIANHVYSPKFIAITVGLGLAGVLISKLTKQNILGAFVFGTVGLMGGAAIALKVAAPVKMPS